MDPGHVFLEKLKLVPNLVCEDPSIITPTNSSFMDLPFSEFSKILDQRRSSAATISSNASSSTDLSTTNDDSTCLWDAQIGFPEETTRQSSV
ncbi:hypothetical protein INT44_003034 [Umbelopsis vinacea]|uniref:Uncharacterized protein n=1 Tax=Umbelopsis vinacea TaxID=44442 RepID=A0A8H7Q7T3_9FUNG|nr:hypothetical protein INT44_003034 [Umbelopsis vinacea]